MLNKLDIDTILISHQLICNSCCCIEYLSVDYACVTIRRLFRAPHRLYESKALSGDPGLEGTDGEGMGSQPVTAASFLIAADMYSAGVWCLVPTADGNNSCLSALQIWCVCIDRCR